MCGIVGMIGNIATTSGAQDMRWFNAALVADTVRGPHSTGVFFASRAVKNGQVQNGEVRARFIKDVVTGAEFVYEGYMDELLKPARPKNWNQRSIDAPGIMVGHNRAATTGKIDLQSAHPFRVGRILMIHNGTLDTYQNGLREEGKDLSWEDGNGKVHPVPDVDSAWIAYNMNKYGIQDTLERIEGSFCVIAVDLQEGKLYMARNEQRPLRYFQRAGVLHFGSEDSILEFANKRAGVTQQQEVDSLPHGELWSFDLNQHKHAILNTKEVTPLDLKPVTTTYSGYGGKGYRSGGYGASTVGWSNAPDQSVSSRFGSSSYVRGASDKEKQALFSALIANGYASRVRGSGGQYVIWIDNTDPTFATKQSGYHGDPAGLNRMFVEGLVRYDEVNEDPGTKPAKYQNELSTVMRVCVFGAPVAAVNAPTIEKETKSVMGPVHSVIVERVEHRNRQHGIKTYLRYRIVVDPTDTMMFDDYGNFVGCSYTKEEVDRMKSHSPSSRRAGGGDNVIPLDDKSGKGSTESSYGGSVNSSNSKNRNLKNISKEAVKDYTPKGARWATQDRNGHVKYWEHQPHAHNGKQAWTHNQDKPMRTVQHNPLNGCKLLHNPDWQWTLMDVSIDGGNRSEDNSDTITEEDASDEVADYLLARDEDERKVYLGPGGSIIDYNTWADMTKDGCQYCGSVLRSDEHELITWNEGAPYCHHCIDVVGKQVH